MNAPTPGRFRELADQGLSVIPIRHPARDDEPEGKRGKKPTVAWERYQKAAAPAELVERWERNGLNVGLVTGSVSGLVVLDLDREDLLGELRRRGFELPETTTVRTGRGWHFYFRHPGGRIGNTAGLAGISGLDLRGDGGYVVAPGSLHESGRVYSWERGLEALQDPPSWLLELIRKPKERPKPAPATPGGNGKRPAAEGEDRYARAALQGEVARVTGAAKGTRNNTLNRAAFALGQLVEAGRLDQAEAERELTAAAEACGLTGDDGADSVRKTIASGLEDGKANPRPRETAPAPRRGSTEGNGRKNPPAEEAPEKPPVTFQLTPEPEPVSLEQLLSVYRRWLYLPDEEPLLAAIGAVVANRSPDGDPVWLLLVAPPGFGKTESINPFIALPDVHAAGTLTESSLLSGVPKKDQAHGAKGGLLRAIGEQGILLLKDFGSVLSMNREGRAALLAALREIFDGSWTRHVGADGGKTLEWRGRLGLLAGCTGSIDSHHGVMASLGERFLFVRMRATASPAEQARRALNHAGREGSMRRELSEAVVGFFRSIPSGVDLEGPTPDEVEDLVALCAAVARCRSAVERDAYRREIELIPGAEAPTRLSVTLCRLFLGLLTAGVDRPRAWRVIRRIALDSMPALRLAVLRELLNRGETGTGDLARALGYPTQTTRRTLEDLGVYGVVERVSQGRGKEDKWRLEGDLEALFGTFPEMSGRDMLEVCKTSAPLPTPTANTPSDISGTVPDVGF